MLPDATLRDALLRDGLLREGLVRDRVRSVRVSLGWAVQTSIAAGLAWFVAHNLLGHVQPFFAPIAAVVVLAVSVGQRLRRAFELVAGNAVGILLGEVLILIIGRGAWQISLLILIAIVLAVFVGGSAPLVTQAASSASLVATLIPLEENYFLSRFIDAVIGGVIGIGVMALLVPLNPLKVVQRAAHPALDDLARGLTETAGALEDASPDRAKAAMELLREAEGHVRGYREAIAAGQEISMVAPLRWRSRGTLSQYVEAFPDTARALRNTRVLTRRSLSVIVDVEPIPPSLPEAVRSLAEAVTWMRRELATGAEPLASRGAALHAVRLGAEAYDEGVGFSGSVVVAQIRSTASDLVTASGVTPEEAHSLVRQTAALPSA